MRKKQQPILALGVVGLLVLAAGSLFITLAIAQNHNPPDTPAATLYPIDDFDRYIAGRGIIDKKASDGGGLVVQLGEQRELVFDLRHRRRSGTIGVMAGQGEEEDKFQRIVINPSAGNMVQLGAEWVGKDGEIIATPRQPADDNDAPALEAFIVDDAPAYVNGEDDRKAPLEAEAVLIEFEPHRRLIIHLRELRAGVVTVIGGGYSASKTTAAQNILIQPAAANTIYLGTGETLGRAARDE